MDIVLLGGSIIICLLLMANAFCKGTAHYSRYKELKRNKIIAERNQISRRKLNKLEINYGLKGRKDAYGWF